MITKIHTTTIEGTVTASQVCKIADTTISAMMGFVFLGRSEVDVAILPNPGARTLCIMLYKQNGGIANVVETKLDVDQPFRMFRARRPNMIAGYVTNDGHIIIDGLGYNIQTLIVRQGDNSAKVQFTIMPGADIYPEFVTANNDIRANHKMPPIVSLGQGDYAQNYYGNGDI